LSPKIADPARLAHAEPARFADVNRELVAALCEDLYTSRSLTIVPAYQPSVPNTFSPLIRPTIFPDRLYTLSPETWRGRPFFVDRSMSSPSKYELRLGVILPVILITNGSDGFYWSNWFHGLNRFYWLDSGHFRDLRDSARLFSQFPGHLTISFRYQLD
jgi:hypothetical protein